MSKIFKIKDMNNNLYTIYDIDSFFDHINKFHSEGTSIHEENGFYFEVNEEFREKIRNMVRE